MVGVGVGGEKLRIILGWQAVNERVWNCNGFRFRLEL